MLKSILFRQSLTFKKTISYSTKYLFQMSSSKLTNNHINIPYKLGGLNTSQLPSQSVYKVNDQYMRTRFGENIMSNFSQVYRSIVNAIAQQDREYLERVLEKNLVKNLLLSDKLQIIDNNSQIIPRMGKIVMISYAEHDRTFLSKKKIIKMSQSDDGQYLTMRAQGERESNDIPFLFCFNVYFKSNMRLVETNQTPESMENKEQVHKIQFEIETRIGLTEGLKKSCKIFFKNFFNINKMVEEFQNMILGKNQQDFNWKIGDIDNVLDGNFTSPTQLKNK